MKTTITAQVIDQTLIVTNKPKLASGGENVYQVELTLDSFWDGYGLEAVFWRDKKRQYRVVLVEGVGTIPYEVTAEPGEVHFSVRGVSGSIVRSTEAVVLNFVQGPPSAGSYPAPLPDVYKQVLSAQGKNEQDIAVERARIDNQLSAGTVDGELVDIRVDADGRTHDTAGAAVRANSVLRGLNITDDLDIYTEPMCALCAASAANVPVTETGVVINDRVRVGSGWLVQRYFAMNTNNAYWRTLRVGKTWSEWHKYRRDDYSKWIAEGEDLDSVLEDDVYFAMCAMGATNAPAEATSNGMLSLIPYSSGDNIWYAQMWLDANLANAFVRQCRDGAWSDWEHIYCRAKAESAMPKTVVFMGDSVFGNNQSATGIVNLYAARTGDNCYNFAFGGSHAKNRPNGLAALDAESLCAAIVSGDFTEQRAAVESNTVADYFESSVEAMAAFDFSTCDVLVCNWGTNDWNSGTPYADYFAAMSTFVETMQRAFPKIRIFKMTPTQRFKESTDGTLVSGNEYESSGVTLREFISGETQFTEKYNLPVIDAYNIGINGYNKDYYFSGGDYTHQNEHGRALIAAKLAKDVY